MDFMSLVDVKTLSPVFIRYGLISRYDMEFLHLLRIIDSDQVKFMFVKLLCLGKEGYEKFKDCLKDSYVMEYAGYIDLNHKVCHHCSCINVAIVCLPGSERK